MKYPNLNLFSASIVRICTIGVVLLTVASIGLNIADGQGAQNNESGTFGGFTGPKVPALPLILGDYCNTGVRTPTKRTDIPKLVGTLKQINAKDYMHLVWTDSAYPSAWNDFQVMAPEFQKANINLWLYITPPSEGVPDPFGADYVKWAIECAKIANMYPIIKGLVIDDFNSNVATFSPAYCRKMMTEAHKITPHLSLLAVSYYGREKTITKHVEQGAIDGVIFPYFSKPLNLHESSQLYAQISSYRKSLDITTKKLKISRKMPLIVMVYASILSGSPDFPTPNYVKECLDIAISATHEGLANGVVTYCLPKDRPEFLDSVTNAYKSW